MKKFRIVILFFLCLLVSSCNRETNVSVSGITLVTNDQTMYIGESVKLEATIIPYNATVQDILWSSNNNSVATVSTDGVVTAKSRGHAVINAVSKDGGYKDICNVTVIEKEPESVNVTGIQWAEEGASTCARSIQKGNSLTLEVTILPNNATNKNIVWDSSDESIAVVSREGVVVAISPGDVVISATTQDGGYKAACNLNVFELVYGITLSETALTLKEYEQKLLIATITPDDATDKSVVWASSDPTVAVVAYGNVTALKAGTCEITATHGDYSARCEVEVTCPIEAIELSDHALTMKVGEYCQLVASVYPDRASDKTLEWSSANPGVASVSADGLVTGIGLGETEITVTSVDNPSAVAQCKVKVIATEISVSPETLDIYENGEPVQLTVTGADPKDITWTSRDKAIATVDANGKVSGLKAGTTEIYAVCTDGGSMAFCRVNVHTHVQSIDVYHDGKLVEDDEIVNVFIHENVEFEAVLQPKETILDKTVSWSSSDKEVLAWWEDEQKFYAKSTGDATVTVTAADGGATASVKVHVGEHVSSVSIEPESILEGFYVDEHVVIKAVVQPADAINKKVVWSSENNSIVSVRDNGDGSARLSALKHGSVYITAKSVDGGKEGRCKVTVSSKVDGVTIYEGTTNVTGETRKVRVGTQKTLRAEVTPATVPDKSVEWKSSDEKVASVNSNGVVEFVGAGKVDISAASVLGGASASTSFDVRSDIKKIILDKSEANMIKGGTIRLSATAEPGDAYNTMMRWESDDEDVASVSQDGVVSAHKSGKAVITVRSTAISGVSASCVVTVTSPVLAVTMSPEVASIEVGENMTLTATVLPADADNPNVRWESSDERIVTVSNQGQIRGIAPGYAVVTVYSEENPDIKSKCAVNVIMGRKPVTSIIFDVTIMQMNVNSTYQIVAAVLPNDATFKTLTWTTSDESVATVDYNGLVSAKAEGSTNIVARAIDGSGKSATCSITVVDPRISR